MREKFWLFLFIVLQCSRASAATIIVESPIVKLVANLAQLHGFCAAEGSFDACTTFVAYRLETNCHESGSAWQMTTHVSFRPWVHLYNLGEMAHERLHVEDVHDSVGRYADVLESAVFSTSSACEAAGLTARGGFESKMLEFARASNDRRHPDHAMPASRKTGKRSVEASR